MIYLVRHGLDDETFIGGYSNVPLIEEGKKQIESSARFLKSNITNINKIYTSDVLRAVQSAHIINKYLNLDIEEVKILREQDKGILNGMLKKQAKKLYPFYIDISDIFTKYPSGESMIDLYKRIKLFLEKIDKYDNTLLVTHRGVINMLYTLILNNELSMDKERYNVTHASIHELDLERKKIRRIK